MSLDLFSSLFLLSFSTFLSLVNLLYFYILICNLYKLLLSSSVSLLMVKVLWTNQFGYLCFTNLATQLIQSKLKCSAGSLNPFSSTPFATAATAGQTKCSPSSTSLSFTPLPVWPQLNLSGISNWEIKVQFLFILPPLCAASAHARPPTHQTRAQFAMSVVERKGEERGAVVSGPGGNRNSWSPGRQLVLRLQQLQQQQLQCSVRGKWKQVKCK